jgi:hypothetical protein
MPFEFRPEFHFDLKLEVVWPKLKGAFKGLASAFRGMNPFKSLRLESEGYARLWRGAARVLACLAAAAIVIVIAAKLLFR